MKAIKIIFAMNASNWGRIFPAFIVFLVFTIFAISPTSTKADVAIDGERLTVTTTNIIAVFKAGDLVRLYNRITKEDYIHTTVVQPSMLNLAMLRPPVGAHYITQAGWHKGSTAGRNEESAQIQFNDLTRAMWMNVLVDGETQDIIVQLWGEANREGVTGLHWGLRGIDLTAGKLILPAMGGCYVDANSAPEKLQLHYPGDWEAQMAIWQGKGGGFVVYTRDERVRCKQLQLIRKGSYADLALITEAQAPYEKAGGVPQMEWRINTYKGDWRTPAQGYRKLMQFYRPPAPASGDREWIKSIRTGVVLDAAVLNRETLDQLAKKCDPAKTLLYLPNWRKLPGETGFPDLQPREGVAEFTEMAHMRGFHMLLRADLLSVSPNSDVYTKLKSYQTRDSTTGKPTGIHWTSETDPARYAILNPAARSVQNWVSQQAETMMRDLHADALYIPHSGDLRNDGSYLVENRTFAEGVIALHRRLMTDFPGLVIANDSTNELLSPYSFLSGRSACSLPSHRICSYLFGDHVLPIQLDASSNTKAGPPQYIGQWESQGIYPTAHVSKLEDLTNTTSEANRMLALGSIWQKNDLRPDFGPCDEFTQFQWFGKDNTLVEVREKNGIVTLKNGETTLYTRITGVNSAVTSGRIFDWPAYSAKGPIGLNPKLSYWLFPEPPQSGETHISELPAGVMLDGFKKSDRLIFRLKAVRGLETADVKLTLAQPTLTFGDIKPTRMEGNVAVFEALKLPTVIEVILK